jgi:hypothetical protein
MDCAHARMVGAGVGKLLVQAGMMEPQIGESHSMVLGVETSGVQHALLRTCCCESREFAVGTAPLPERGRLALVGLSRAVELFLVGCVGPGSALDVPVGQPTFTTER